MNSFSILISLIIICLSKKSFGNNRVNYHVPISHDALVNTVLRLQYIENMCQTSYKMEEKFEELNKQQDATLRVSIKWYLETLQCAYMNEVLLHMLLTFNLFVAENKEFEKKFELVVKYKAIIRDMIATAYNLGSRELNVLWITYIYMEKLLEAPTSEIMFLRTTSTGKNLPNVAFIHSAIIKRLKTTLTSSDCGGYDKKNFNFEEHEISECKLKNNDKICIINVEKRINSNISSIEQLMKKHKDNEVIPENLEYFTTDQLFIYDIVKSKDFMNDLTKKFIVEIEWKNITDELIMLNEKSRTLDSLVSGSTCLIAYQKLFLNFIKLIIVRMTRKHLIYQSKETNTLNNIKSFSKIREKKFNYSKEIIDVLKDFVNFFQFTKEDELTSIFEMLKKYLEIKQFQKSKLTVSEVINFVKKKETEIISNYFHKTIKVNSLGIKLVNSSNFKLIEEFAKQKGISIEYLEVQNPIELNLQIMKILYKYLKDHSALKNMNFGIITAFITSNERYIV
ncbi:uncharacterized protein LOC126910316 isoform X1 [Daktulosphaira vitifoliae]|uniref:uncharacterized protein LOC126910316 isoform X1 n=1 Tax=Daktulosphaira vitifoliae TaxID=58002 RepID=UPI0021AAB63B|nr:uncharacterized protein LOC126910316 isoform X1 [Daktulosphaira vitifoliae]